MKIKAPTILIDKSIALKNIERMVQKAKKNNLLLRPHFKTHQSIEVGEWFRSFGIESITVSSVRMARCFANAGWKDITIAFPVNVLEIEEINALAKEIKLNLLVDNIDSVLFLQQNIEASVDIWIKIDAGYHRAGISWNEYEEVAKLADKINISEKLNFAGILIHSGHSYKSTKESEILEVHREAMERIAILKEKLVQNGFKHAKVSTGDTPTASIAQDFVGADELRPGNFIYYDLKQLQIGSCSEEDIAIRVACPVVSKKEEPLELIIYGGAVHFSKDTTQDEEGRWIFGYLTENEDDKWGKIIKETYVKSLSQEHGIVQVDKERFEKINIGDVVQVIPVHSCLAVNANDKFRLTTGEEFPILCK